MCSFIYFAVSTRCGGAAVSLPQEVREKMPNRRPGLNPPPPRRKEDGRTGRTAGNVGPPGRLIRKSAGQQDRPPQKSPGPYHVPSRYWVIAPMILPDKQHRAGPGPERAPLVPMTCDRGVREPQRGRIIL